MHLAYQIAEKGGIDHPFQNGLAGRKWFDGFRRRYPIFTLHSPQSLSYLRAKAGIPTILENFLQNLDQSMLVSISSLNLYKCIM